MSDQTRRAALPAVEANIRKLKERGVSISLGLDDVGAAVDAYVTSAVAARMLAPLGRKPAAAPRRR